MDFEFYCSLFSRYGLEITEEKYEKFEKYSAFLVEYNQKVNLTAITDPQEIVVKHFLDSCLLLKYADIPYGAALIDVGTGAGFPSVPLKIMRPDIKITLLDSLAKRITFLQKLCELIGEDADFITDAYTVIKADQDKVKKLEDELKALKAKSLLALAASYDEKDIASLQLAAERAKKAAALAEEGLFANASVRSEALLLLGSLAQKLSDYYTRMIGDEMSSVL